MMIDNPPSDEYIEKVRQQAKKEVLDDWIRIEKIVIDYIKNEKRRLKLK